MLLNVYYATIDLCASDAKKALKVSYSLNLKLQIEIITNEVATSVIQLEDTLNLPESMFYIISNFNYR